MRTKAIKRFGTTRKRKRQDKSGTGDKIKWKFKRCGSKVVDLLQRKFEQDCKEKKWKGISGKTDMAITTVGGPDLGFVIAKTGK